MNISQHVFYIAYTFNRKWKCVKSLDGISPAVSKKIKEFKKVMRPAGSGEQQLELLLEPLILKSGSRFGRVKKETPSALIEVPNTFMRTLKQRQTTRGRKHLRSARFVPTDLTGRQMSSLNFYLGGHTGARLKY